MPAIALATGAYRSPTPGLPDRVTENCWKERGRTTPDGEFQVRTRPGTLKLPDWVTAARGYGHTDGFAGGKILVVVGTTLKTYDPATGTVGTITGTVAGTDRVRFAHREIDPSTADGEKACCILANGWPYFTDGATVAAAADADFQNLLDDHEADAFLDVQSIGQKFVFQYGSRFCYTPPLQSDSITSLSYYTAEYKSDQLVGGVVVNERLLNMGTRTIEPWEETADVDDPFRRSLGLTSEWGCLARDSIVMLAGQPYWIDTDYQVCRITGAGVEVLSEPFLSSLIEETDPADVLCFGFQHEGHAFYGVWTPTGCYAYDAGRPQAGGPEYAEWIRFRTRHSDTWAYGFVLRAGGQLFVGHADGVGFAKMHPDYKSDHMPDASTMGLEIRGVVSGYILTDKVRPMRALRGEGAKGIGLATGQGSDPQIMMRRSLKGPNIFTSTRSRSLGAIGEFAKRVIWNQMGMIFPPGTAVELSWSDPVAPIITGIYED